MSKTWFSILESNLIITAVVDKIVRFVSFSNFYYYKNDFKSYLESCLKSYFKPFFDASLTKEDSTLSFKLSGP